jgi:GT2 family glycosyltransferase
MARYRVTINAEAEDVPLVILVRFLDPTSRQVRRTLPVLLKSTTYSVNGFDLEGDELIETVIGNRVSAQIRIGITRRSKIYRFLREAVDVASRLGRRQPKSAARALVASSPIRSPIPSPTPMVSLIIPTRDRIDLLERAVRTLFEKSDYPSLELLIVDNGSVEEKTLLKLREYQGDRRVRILVQDTPFNFAQLNNAAAREARGDILAFMNNDVEAKSPDWVNHLVSLLSGNEVGAVGAKLAYPDGTVQHAGVVLGIGGLAGHIGRGVADSYPGPNGMFLKDREVSAVTAACLFTQRSLFLEAGGFDERFAVEFNDIDYCLRLREVGKRVICAATPVLIHSEGTTRGVRRTPSLQVMEEQTLFVQLWGHALAVDPYAPPDWPLETERWPQR